MRSLRNGFVLSIVLIYILRDAARAAGIADLNRWLETGALKHPVARRVPLTEGWAAHEACESNTRIGAALIDVAEGV